jgi:hypothetical protein
LIHQIDRGDTPVSSDKVDLSQIRGDWDFHSRYVTNAMNQTLKRVQKSWKALNKASSKKDQVPVGGQLMDEFIEAVMQARAITDDYTMLAECKPSGKKKKTKKKTSKKTAKKKTKKKAAKKKGGGK